jgi:hypothetical protein
MAPKLDPTEARQGEKTTYMRYVLGLSLGAVIVIFLILLLIWT